MPTSQQTANESLARWQALRAAGLTADERLAVLMRDFFESVPTPLDCEYDATLRTIAAIMEAA